MTAIHLSTNLHEKMEYILAEFIGELEAEGIIEKAKESFKSTFNLNYNIYYNIYIINELFEDTSPKLNKVSMFNRIADNYFNEEDKNELQKYYMDYYTAIRWSQRRKDKWLENKNYYMYMIGHLFSKTNKQFIMEQIECISSIVIR
jgi:hypothetical protein